jgi:ESX secretion-associated protein EspG
MQEARRLDMLLRVPRMGGAQLYVARRDHASTRRRADGWITVLDLAGHGQWAIYATVGREERFVNAVPATPQWLAAKLSELLRSLG